MSSILTIILTHQPQGAVSKMLNYWQDYTSLDDILVAYGGPKEQFDAIAHPNKAYIDDPGLRTRDHQRELQSYNAIFSAGADFLETQSQFDFVHFMEFDHLPLVPDLHKRLIAKLQSEKADMLGFHLHRVDDTSNAHFLYYIQQFHSSSYWSRISRRSDKAVVLSMFGTGSFWRRDVFRAVARTEEPFRMYMELYLPTLAHHLGFRLRDFGDEQDRFVQVLRDATPGIEQAKRQGAWTLHPVKYLWSR